MAHRLSPFLSVVLAVAFGACGSLVLPDNPTAEQRFRAGMEEYNRGSYADALQHFDIIRLQYPGSAIADSARYVSGLARFHREEYLLASYEFSQLIQNNPSSKLLPDAQFMYARCFVELSPRPALDQTYTVRAIDALQTFIELYPQHPKVGEAEQDILKLTDKLAKKEFDTGVLYTKLDNWRSALVYFSTVIDRYYNTPYAADALALKIRILMAHKQSAEAEPLIRMFLEKYPDSTYREEIDRYRSALTAAPAHSGSASVRPTAETGSMP